MTILKGQGITPTEKTLAELCERVFLPLWSFPNVFRGPGKELCDLLALTGEDIVVFSDKDADLGFPSVRDSAGGKNAVLLKRWMRNAIHESARQLQGAERWIRNHPTRVFRDPLAKVPLRLPCDAKNARVHRVLVANGAQRAMAKFWGEAKSPSLMLNSFFRGNRWPDITQPLAPATGVDDFSGKEWLKTIENAAFQVGDLDPASAFIHIFDETGIRIVMEEMDTGTDLVKYLAKREALFRRDDLNFLATDEAAMLSHYLSYTGEDNEHDFFFAQKAKPETKGPGKIIGVSPAWGGHGKETMLRQLRAKDREDAPSYFWDRLISQLGDGHRRLCDTGKNTPLRRALDIMAREPRFDRRMICKQIFPGVLRTRDAPDSKARWLGQRPSRTEPGCVYVFLATAGKNIAKQKRMLEAACVLALTRKNYLPEHQRIAVGVLLGEGYSYATSVARGELDQPRIYRADRDGNRYGIFKKVEKSRQQGQEFPDD